MAPRWTDDELREVVRLRLAGHCLKEIACSFPGRSTHQISGKLSSMVRWGGLVLPRKGEAPQHPPEGGLERARRVLAAEIAAARAEWGRTPPYKTGSWV